MHKRLGAMLALYGTFLLVCGIMGYLITGETSKSSLFNGGVFGSMMIVVGMLLRQGRMWTMPAAVSATGIFTLTFVWRGAIQWYAVYTGESSHTSVAVLLTLMVVVSVLVLRTMIAHYRH